MNTTADTTTDRLLTHSSWVRQLAFSLTRDPNEADELVQETWLRALRHPPRRGVPVRAWLSRVLHNAAHNRRRDTAREQAREREHGARGSAASPSVAETLERADLHAFLAHALQQLDREERAMIAMRYLEELPPRVIATRLGLSVETVRKRLQRARARLRERLERRHGSDWRALCVAFAGLPPRPVVHAAALSKPALATAAVAIVAGVTWGAGRLGSADSTERDAGDSMPVTSTVRDTQPASAPVVQPLVARRSPARAPLAQDPVDELNRLLRAWFGAWHHYQTDAEDAATRRRLDRLQRNAEAAFLDAWDRTDSRDEILADPDRLVALFRNAFPHGEPTTPVGEIAAGSGPQGDYSYFVPADYDRERSYPTMVLVPGLRTADEFEDPAACLKRTWLERATELELIVMAADVENTAMAAPWTADDERAEIGRIGAVLGPTGELQRAFRLDRRRLVLDCGRGSSAFGLRLATYFPTRFAGLVLRAPRVDDGLRLDSLHGLPLLLISNPGTVDACLALHAKLEEMAPGSCELLDERLPDAELSARIAQWVMQRERPLCPTTVVVAPNLEQFRRAHWVRLGELTGAEPPFLRAIADREANRISVATRGIEDFTLSLCDALVDVHRFELVVNGVVRTIESTPGIRLVAERAKQRFDATSPFTAEVQVVVPRPR